MRLPDGSWVGDEKHRTRVASHEVNLGQPFGLSGAARAPVDSPRVRRRCQGALEVHHVVKRYQDIILRLDPMIIELERTRKPVLVIAHNAVLRALYAYFQGVPRERCPYLAMPLHTVIELTPHA